MDVCECVIVALIHVVDDFDNRVGSRGPSLYLLHCKRTCKRPIRRLTSSLTRGVMHLRRHADHAESPHMFVDILYECLFVPLSSVCVINVDLWLCSSISTNIILFVYIMYFC